jgi:hypothetical protein
MRAGRWLEGHERGQRYGAKRSDKHPVTTPPTPWSLVTC